MEITDIDHIYLSVSNLEKSEEFYDPIMEALGFKKGDDAVNGEPHVHYFNKSMQISLRPARVSLTFNPYAPGLHHLCFQVSNKADIDDAAKLLKLLGIKVTEPKEYPEYAKGYYSFYFNDPDGIRLEMVARTEIRDLISNRWDELEGFLNPIEKLNK